MPSQAISFDDVFRYAYQHDAVLKSLLNKVDLTTVMQAGGQREHRIMLSIFEDIFKDHERGPSSIEIRNLSDDALRQTASFGEVDLELKEGLDRLSSYLMQPLSDIDKERYSAVSEFLSDTYKEHVGKPRIREAMQEAEKTGNFDKLQQVTAEVNVKASSFRKVNSALDGSKVEDHVPIKTGVNWFDDMIGGGLGAMLAYGIIIPTGCGKTTLTSQLSISMSARGKKVVVVFSEQSMKEREMVDRFRAMALTRKYAEVTGWPSAGIPEEVAKNDKAAPIWDAVNSNLQIYDRDDCPASIEEIEAIMSGANGFQPDVVIIDWVGLFAENMLAVNTEKYGGYTITQAIQSVADKMAEYSSKYAVPSILFHQSAGKFARAKPTKAISITDGLQCSTFCTNLAYGIGIGTHDKNGNCLFNLDKSRYSNNQGEAGATGDGRTRVLRFSKDFLRFDEARNFKVSNGKFVAVGREGKMPDEKKRPAELQLDLSDKGTVMDV